MGVLGYLPSRYLINFVFGGVFALKAGYSGAVNKAEIFKYGRFGTALTIELAT